MAIHPFSLQKARVLVDQSAYNLRSQKTNSSHRSKAKQGQTWGHRPSVFADSIW
jgi:hypothetical protein